MKNDTVPILLVDDDRVDVMAVRRVFRDLKVVNPVIEVHNGIEALAHLRGENGYEKAPSPCLVLLDLKMPRMGGFEFLAELRNDPVLRSTLVIVITTSIGEEDRRRAYDMNVAGYVLKHHLAQSFLETIRVLEAYWQEIEFPPVPQPSRP